MMLPGMDGLLGQARKLQEELKKETVEFSAGGGMVRAVASGRMEIVSLRIEKEIVNPDDVEMLQDVITAAINGALGKAREAVREKMSATMGFDIGTLMG